MRGCYIFGYKYSLQKVNLILLDPLYLNCIIHSKIHSKYIVIIHSKTGQKQANVRWDSAKKRGRGLLVLLNLGTRLLTYNNH